MKTNKFNLKIVYVSCLLLGLFMGSCTVEDYEDDSYERIVKEPCTSPLDKQENHATGGEDGEVDPGRGND